MQRREGRRPGYAEVARSVGRGDPLALGGGVGEGFSCDAVDEQEPEESGQDCTAGSAGIVAVRDPVR